MCTAVAKTSIPLAKVIDFRSLPCYFGTFWRTCYNDVTTMLLCAAVSQTCETVRMILAPIVLYFVAYAIDIHYFHPRGQTRPLAFWAPALIVAAMPTANNLHLGRLGPGLESSEMRLVYNVYIEILKTFKDKVHRSIETLDYGHSLLCKWDENEMPSRM